VRPKCKSTPKHGSNYGKRLRRAARKNFGNFWSSHRWWVTFSTVVSPFLIQAISHGWRNLLTLHEALESTAFALALSLAGNYLIALWGGAKSLDAELRSQLTQEHDAPEDYHSRVARETVEKLTAQEKQVLMHLWNCGSSPLLTRRGFTLNQISGVGSDEVRRILSQLGRTPIVLSKRDRDHTGPYETWEVQQGFRDALKKLLFGYGVPPLYRFQ
jgi:hypothetical protein